MHIQDGSTAAGTTDDLARFDDLLRKLDNDGSCALDEYAVDFADLLESLTQLVQQLKALALEDPGALSRARLEWMRDEIVYHVPSHLANVVAALTLILVACQSKVTSDGE